MDQFLPLFTTENITKFFFKAFAIVLSVVYLIYVIVLRRQVMVMLKTLIVKNGNILNTISLIQVFIAILLVILVFVLV
jgi:hypothetical protein